jgi:hypothetical protein
MFTKSIETTFKYHTTNLADNNLTTLTNLSIDCVPSLK